MLKTRITCQFKNRANGQNAGLGRGRNWTPSRLLWPTFQGVHSFPGGQPPANFSPDHLLVLSILTFPQLLPFRTLQSTFFYFTYLRRNIPHARSVRVHNHQRRLRGHNAVCAETQWRSHGSIPTSGKDLWPQLLRWATFRQLGYLPKQTPGDYY